MQKRPPPPPAWALGYLEEVWMLAHSQVRLALYGQGPALGLTSDWAQAGKGGLFQGPLLTPGQVPPSTPGTFSLPDRGSCLL